MKNMLDKRAIIFIVFFSVLFISLLGVLFYQVGKHFIVQSEESQLQTYTQAIEEEIEDAETGDVVPVLENFEERYSLDFFYSDQSAEEFYHTLTTSNVLLLREIRSQGEGQESSKVIEDRIVYFTELNGNTLALLSADTSIATYRTTMIWIVIFFSLFSAILIIGFGNRLYESYVEPVRKATTTTKSLADGDFKARIHDVPYGFASNLSQSINQLARHLENLTSKYENQNNRLKTVINNMESGALLINEHGMVRLTNEAFIQQFKIDASEIFGEIYYEIVPHEPLNQLIQSAIFTEKKKQGTFEIEGGKYVNIYVAPIKDEEKEWKGVIVVSHEVTEIKRLENIRKDFVANVSHELRTPITSIQGFAETLLDGNTDDPELVEQFLLIIEKESKRLNLLIQDLLQLSVIEKDDFTLDLSTFSAQELMNHVAQIMHEQVQEKSIDLKITVESDLFIQADYYRLQQLILNLFSNAIKYSNPQGSIDWEVYKDEQEVIIKVVDTGIGMNSEEQERIFERFYRVDKGRSRDSGGTGLGLSIVKHIVEAHEGNIEIDSKADHGTTILIRIPQETGNLLL
ncbi:two-component system histidine kinase PnpS [Halalkalibacillus halophilus]|uniref:two-component system histidine kinase PnpS n=1 Tax=Halalkalibacillus halophilus TaxID=392827 RepID=UPI00146C228D|nr:ATP-binding protein [Halalkalibacillus halophilus]